MKKKKRNNILNIIKEFMTYDRVYYEGKLSSLIIAILCFSIMILFILALILLGGVYNG